MTLTNCSGSLSNLRKTSGCLLQAFIICARLGDRTIATWIIAPGQFPRLIAPRIIAPPPWIIAPG